MHTKRILGFLFIIVFNVPLISSAETVEHLDYYSPENILKFADHLYEQEDYLRAAGEYQRYLFYKPSKKEGILFKVALCYRLGSRPKQAIEIYETFLKESPNSKLSSKTYYQIGVSYFLMEQYPVVIEYLDRSLPRITDEKVQADSQQLIGLSHLMQKKWTEANDIFNLLQKSEFTEVRNSTAIYSKYATQGKQLPTRSPFLAGFFSAIIPGAGRLYTGSFSDAMTSFFTVGITGWQSYDGFRRDGITSVKGWTLGTLSSIFYLGNIYGSAISAKVYNRHVSDELLTTFSIQLPF